MYYILSYIFSTNYSHTFELIINLCESLWQQKKKAFYT